MSSLASLAPEAPALSALERAIPVPRPTQQPEASIIIVSFNTRELLRECLISAFAQTRHLFAEIIVVDNASTDGSADMVSEAFPSIRLLRCDTNLGFGNANNVALAQATGRFVVLLNSDAFLAPGALDLAIQHMEEHRDCALGGGLLVGRDGLRQPSARQFHTVLGDAIVLSGLAARFPTSRWFGRFDRTWADPFQPCCVDWVPGAFSIIRPEALKAVGFFDPDFFLYYEEVDLCLRLKHAGYTIRYWPDIVITHLGGESSRQIKTLHFSGAAAQIVLWRMRSTLLYYRKHQGAAARFALWMERTLYAASFLRNLFAREPRRVARREHSRTLLRLLAQAWKDTAGGRISPPQPW